jgi:hypothetical protein
MKALVAGPIAPDRLAAVMGCDVERAVGLASDMEREGLVITVGLAVRLP